MKWSVYKGLYSSIINQRREAQGHSRRLAMQPSLAGSNLFGKLSKEKLVSLGKSIHTAFGRHCTQWWSSPTRSDTGQTSLSAAFQCSGHSAWLATAGHKEYEVQEGRNADCVVICAETRINQLLEVMCKAGMRPPYRKALAAFQRHSMEGRSKDGFY